MRELEFPFNGEYIVTKKRAIKRQLLESGAATGTPKKIAILGGSTTSHIKDCLELFLLDKGIPCEFYESEYNRYYEDLMFDNPELKEFAPDVIFIHTTFRNIKNLPAISDSKEDVAAKLDAEYKKFETLWAKAKSLYGCVLIQNNFELPYVRSLGSIDATEYRGYVRFVNDLNAKFADYAEANEGFWINDINYASACFGLDKWAEPSYWQLYKYAVALPAIPHMAFELSNLIGSIFGKTKKVVCLDLDNTLWGGVIGDDGPERIEIGQETALAETYSEFQEYLKTLAARGILLTINSKNEEDVALKGFERPDSVLRKEDFVNRKINWNPKSENLVKMAGELNLLPESFVFVDDNPAEREIVRQQVKGCRVPELTTPETYAYMIDRSGYFNPAAVSDDDLKRVGMYKENAKRLELEESFADYGEYLNSLEMEGEIGPFKDIYFSRIAQLTNKSNQFNLTTKRFSENDIINMASDGNRITLYGKLVDKFGDNGVVSVVEGEIKGDVLDIELWLMSCRVLKRDMEYAMLDKLVEAAKAKGIKTLKGNFYPTAKNKMVREFYDTMGFTLTEEDGEGNRYYTLDISEYKKQNNYIRMV
ncbi:MAG: HAD family hydrolase [Lachnospiraceae bacterium]|nr:HAD family hydrolase [Lachnospiraceae bacterium]